MTRMFDIREPSLEALRQAPIYFRYGSNKNRVLIDCLTAQAILACYAALERQDLREKFERMVCKDQRTLKVLVSFCWKHVKLS